MDQAGTTTLQPGHQSNGRLNGKPDPDPEDLLKILQALQAIYDPRSSNTIRQNASHYLEEAKKSPEAPSHGFTLARDKVQPAPLRHFGLSMLEYAIKYGWEDFLVEQQSILRKCVTELARSVDEKEPLYLRNKIAQLWTEIAKRCWGAEWMDMDEMLVTLWNTSLEQQGIVLYVLESLSEEVFTREDPTAILRGNELGKACVEIFTPTSVLVEFFPTRDTSVNVRHADEGWMRRLCVRLDWCLSNDYSKDERIRTCAIKVLSALRATLVWITPKAIHATQCVEHIFKALATTTVPLQKAAVEALYTITGRAHLQDDEFVEIICPMYTPNCITLLSELYSWARVDIHDLDDEKYALSKKLSELLSNLGNYAEAKSQLIPTGHDLRGLMELLFTVLKDPSLVISIPILHTWTKLLKHRDVKDAVTQFLGGMLELCSQRLVRYENLPENSDDNISLFLNEDFDTLPEKHAFLGNYRRYCVDIVEIITRRAPFEALQHILGQAKALLKNIYGELPPFQAQDFSKNAIPVLRVDAQISVIESSLRGYLKWLASQGGDPQEDERNRTAAQDHFQSWCMSILEIRFEDPEIAKKMVQLMVTFSTKALNDRPSFAITLVKYMLDFPDMDIPAHAQYSEAVKSMEQANALEMQRLAIVFANYFLSIYDELERKITEVLTSRPTDDKLRFGYMAVLYIIIHRSTSLDRSVQMTRLAEILRPVKEAWQTPELERSLSSFEAFLETLGLSHLREFLSSRQFHRIEDWSTQELDKEGQDMQADILSRCQQLPLRITRTLLAGATEKVDDCSPALEMSSALWADIIPIMLPNLLQLVKYAQAFNNPESWPNLPHELQLVVKRLLTDRFWQAGISRESKDDFFARVNNSKTTFEGYASTVRGTMRQIREGTYHILYGLTRFKDRFYGFTDLPGPLSESLFANAHALSAHHVSVLLSVATHLIEECPPNQRGHFLPAFVSSLFRVLDSKITAEWAANNKKISEANEDDNLGEEMKTESILRQLTYATVTLVASLLDYQRQGSYNSIPLPRSVHNPFLEPTSKHTHPSQPKEEIMWRFILFCPTILEPVLIFCTNTLRVRDSRCVGLVVKIFRCTFPHFKEKSAIRDFICVDILKAAITSLHEPYFVDVQKDLAGMIAHIIRLDQELPREVILSLPGLGNRPDKVDKAISLIMQQGGDRQHRAIVLDLLQGVRGVSIHEQGKIERAEPRKKSAVQEQYMEVQEQPRIVRGGSPQLAGVGEMLA
ncbi:ARM repeat-containing protein [Patellaria atrata CBS 101060]|uniref:ARM repeat-containing protein n=1 Tax=Patellaria atrata CBS 101060 TaxID=1346257 RepID=A0A9P4S9Q3_9PEZI|nr:ARM repeat-containing protein [Patellaria atrata CBS 101060]